MHKNKDRRIDHTRKPGAVLATVVCAVQARSMACEANLSSPIELSKIGAFAHWQSS